MSFEQAAAVPQAAFIALQALRDHAHVQHGQTVLINGAGGGAGTFAVQLAKAYGAEVTGVDGAHKLVPVIDECFPLSGAAEAFRRIGEKRSKGKVVITM